MGDDSYTGFAEVYDELMDNVPYEEWAAFLTSVLKEYGVGSPPVFGGGGDGCEKTGNGDSEERLKNLVVERNTVLDLGCGTGTLTELLACAGFDMIGLDNSGEMLEAAQRKKEKSGSSTLYLLQDMREFELYGTVGAVCSVCDSLNYLLEDGDMVKVFSLVNNYLYPGGIFVFDFNTVYKYESVIGDATIAENRDDCSFIWENYYDAESRINEYDLTVFVREEGGENFRKFTETHFQKGYTLAQMQDFLEAAGLAFIKALDADTHGEVRPESERIYVIAREKGKKIEE